MGQQTNLCESTHLRIKWLLAGPWRCVTDAEFRNCGESFNSALFYLLCHYPWILEWV
jgi:hypothetical protein